MPLSEELAEIKADYHNIIRKANTAEWERDEARAVARRLFQQERDKAYRAELIEAYPWLKEEG